MFLKKSLCVATILMLSASTLFAGKDLYHYISIPIIDGAGIYSSVQMFNQSTSLNTKAASVTTVSLLACQGALGAFTVFGAEDNYPFLRQAHRYLAFAITAAGIWLSVSGGMDDQVNNLDRNIAYGYTALTTVPIIMFSF